MTDYANAPHETSVIRELRVIADELVDWAVRRPAGASPAEEP